MIAEAVLPDFLTGLHLVVRQACFERLFVGYHNNVLIVMQRMARRRRIWIPFVAAAAMSSLILQLLPSRARAFTLKSQITRPVSTRYLDLLFPFQSTTSTTSSTARTTSYCRLYQSKSSSDELLSYDQIRSSIPKSFEASDWESSDFAIHAAIAQEDAPISATLAIDKALKRHYNAAKIIVEGKDNDNDEMTVYTAQELIELGSAWWLPAADMGNPYKKPIRLSVQDADLKLQTGDYLRIHHDPRRFPAVHLYDWTVPMEPNTKQQCTDDNDNHHSNLPCPVMEYNATTGCIIIHKPPECIPVHPTVDNAQENIAACLRRANPTLEYISTPQRLDQNTSGLITVAASKHFSAYYAKLLRHKTAQQVPISQKDIYNATGDGDDDDKANNQQLHLLPGGIQKRYRVLVCLIPPEDPNAIWSVESSVQKLKAYANDKNKLLRHYLEPSIRAPKRFVAHRPPPSDNNDLSENNWAECVMRIEDVGQLCTLRGNAPSVALSKALWNSKFETMPPKCQAVVELKVELLTGRTHQVRGQLSAEGFPLVGDVPYGGAIPTMSSSSSSSLSHSNKYDTKLGLQCCELKFLDPDTVTGETIKKGRSFQTTTMVPSDRWNTFQLDAAWWTPFLQQYQQDTHQLLNDNDMTSIGAVEDIGLLDGRPKQSKKELAAVELNPEGLPPEAILSPGRHKYVLAKATDPNTGEIHKWFVKSASPQECGGPYHKDVARDLSEWIEACGYDATITGGGRILYQPGPPKRALVYGFSYGFGMGNHALAAKTIKEWSQGDIDSAYDDSPDLY